jgi:hypothetical protein
MLFKKGDKMPKVKILIPVIFMLSLMQQGCIVAGIGAGVGAWKYGSASQKEAYGKYRSSADELNLERLKLGMEEKPVMSYKEWND